MKQQSKEFQAGYEKGRLDEAEITLENLYRVLDEMTEEPHQTSFIFACIRDLEKATGKSRKDFNCDEDE